MSGPPVEREARLAGPAEVPHERGGDVEHRHANQLAGAPAHANLPDRRKLQIRVLLLQIVQVPLRLEEQHRPLLAVDRAQDA